METGKKTVPLAVLMSTYNETEEQLRMAMDSILCQTYRDFVFVIVNDNPEDGRYPQIIGEYQKRDDRILFLQNEKNIGLALSLNRASAACDSKYIARMDADDISLPDRFEKELKHLTSRNADLVFSNYSLIGEDTSPLNGGAPAQDYYPDEKIVRVLSEKQIIHHPTVMMTRACFEAVGKYRNFDCAQDYDLWLRMLNAGVRFSMIDEVLLYYRVRSASISQRKLYLQKITVDYILELFLERVERSSDSYTYQKYQQYVNQRRPKNERQIKQIQTSQNDLLSAITYRKQGRSILAYLIRIKVFLTDPYFRYSYISSKVNHRKVMRYIDQLTNP